MCGCGEQVSFNFLMQIPWIHVHGWWSQDQIHMGSRNSESQSIWYCPNCPEFRKHKYSAFKDKREKELVFLFWNFNEKGEYFDDYDDVDDGVLLSLINQSIYQNHKFLLKSSIVPSIPTWKHHTHKNTHTHTLSLFIYMYIWCLFLFLCFSL